MKQDADRYTLDLLDKPKRGRPRKPDALTAAERAMRYRARKRAARLAKQPKYRGPNGESWTGRGLMPRWMAAQISHFGKTRDDFDTRPGRD